MWAADGHLHHVTVLGHSRWMACGMNGSAAWFTPAGLIVESGRLVRNGQHPGCR